MEGFIRPTEKRSYPLSVFDGQGPSVNIPFAYFYENANGSSDLMPTKLIKESLGKALQQFSILLGNIESKGRGRFAVNVTPENLNLPEVLESECKDIAFDDIKAAGFARTSWPKNLATTEGWAAPKNGVIKLLSVHIVRLKNNTGLALFVCIPHFVVDGAGFFQFVNHWAATMKGSFEEKEPYNPADDAFCLDRTRFLKYFPNERKPVDAFTQSIQSGRNLGADLMARVPPLILARVFRRLGRKKSSNSETHLFHISRESLQKLRDSTQGHAPDGIRLSDNDLLVALLGKTYTQTQPYPQPKGCFGSVSKAKPMFTTLMACDLRPRLRIAETYNGNLFVPINVRESFDDLQQATTPESIVSVALGVRHVVKRMDGPLIAEMHDSAEAHPRRYMRGLFWALKQKGMIMGATSMMRFPMYDADFGFGGPAYVTMVPLGAAGIATGAFMPSPPGRDGVDVVFSCEPEAMKGVLQNKAWLDVCEVIW